MERFPPAKLIKAGNKIIVLINLKRYADLMIFLLQTIKLGYSPTSKITLYNITIHKHEEGGKAYSNIACI